MIFLRADKRENSELPLLLVHQIDVARQVTVETGRNIERCLECPCSAGKAELAAAQPWALRINGWSARRAV